MLVVPSSYIATDIRTGFPNLVSKERSYLDKLIIKNFEDYNRNLPAEEQRPLIYADNFLQIIEEELYDYYFNHQDIELVSCNVNIYTEAQSIPVKHQSDTPR